MVTPQIGFFVAQHYLKDLSFENPIGPISPEAAEGLTISVTGATFGRPLGADNQFVVETTLTITGRKETEPYFICELTYCAEVELSNIPEPVQEQTLCVDVPNYLVQHINHVIDHAGRAGGLPGLRVSNIDFMALYQHARAERAAAKIQ